MSADVGHGDAMRADRDAGGPFRIWQQLRAEGWVDADQAPPLLPEEASTPWYVRLMLGICGWMGGMFLLLFFGVLLIGKLRDDDSALVVMGLLLVGLACLVFRRAGRNDLGQQFALALSLAGQGMLGFWLFATYGTTVVWPLFCIALFQLLLVALMPNFLHRLISTFFSVLAWHVGCLMWLGPSPVLPICAGLVVLLWLDEFHWQVRLRQAFLPIAAGLTLALVCLAFTSVWLPYALLIQVGHGHRYDGFGDGLYRWLYLLDPVVVGLILLLLVAHLARRLTLALRSVAVLCALALAIVGGWSIGVVLGAMLMLLGFARGRFLLTVLGIATSLCYLSWFYYSLQLTLLTKACGLMVLGGMLLIAYFALRRASTEEVANA